MSEISITDFGLNTLCRLCLSSGFATLDLFSYVASFKDLIANTVMNCAPVQISSGDGMPNFICQKCYTRLEKTHQFQMQIVQSEKTLRRYLGQVRGYDKKTNLESSSQRPSKYSLTENTNANIIAKCKSSEVQDVVSYSGENEYEILDSVSRIDNELTSKSKIKVERIDDDSPSPATCADVKRLCEGAEGSTDIDIEDSNLEKGGLANLNSTYKTNEEVSTNFDINMKVHNFTDTDMKFHKCDVCKKSFAILNNLKTHKLTHTGEKPYKCDVCENSYTTSTYLKLHKMIHNGEEPYECNVCNKRFTKVSNLNTHKLVHTEKEYEMLHSVSKINNELTSKPKIKAERIDDDSPSPAECAGEKVKLSYDGGEGSTDIHIKNIKLEEERLANFNSKTNEEVSTTVKIKDEPMDDNSLIPADSASNTIETVFVGGGCELNFENSKTDIGDIKCVDNIGVNGKEIEPANLRSTNTTIKEMSLKCEIKDEPMDNSLIPTDCINDSVNDFSKGDDEIGCEDTNIGFDGASACLRSSDLEEDFENFEEESISASVKREKQRQEDKVMPPQLNINETCSPRRESDTYSSYFNANKLIHTGEKPYNNEIYKKSCNLKSHKFTHTGDKVYKCDVCKKGFVRFKYLKIHKLTHTGEKPYKCDVCKNDYTTSNYLKLHKMIHAGEEPYECNVCNKRFTKESNLNTHKLVHTGVKPYQCDVCKNGYTSLNYLKIHKMIHTGEEPYECNVCNKRFTKVSNLNIHKLVHTGEKPYKCDVCKNCYTSLNYLKIHKMIHTGEEPYECNVCNKRFTKVSNLNTHKLKHTGEKPYKCDVCKNCYTTANYLKIHKMIHTSEEPYECNVCNKRFTQVSNLNTHKLIHTSEKFY